MRDTVGGAINSRLPLEDIARHSDGGRRWGRCSNGTSCSTRDRHLSVFLESGAFVYSNEAPKLFLPSHHQERRSEELLTSGWAVLGGRDKLLVSYPGLIGGNRINLPRTMGG